MRVDFETRLKIFFMLIIAGIIGIAAFTYQFYQSVRKVNAALAHSNHLHSLSQSLLVDIQDLELNSRAYGLSADSNYIPQYQQARKSLAMHLGQIRELTRTNAEFQNRLGTLTILINQKIAYTDRLIEVTNHEGIAGASMFFKTGPADDLMQHMRFTLKTIYSKEGQMLRERQYSNELQMLNLRYTYYALLIMLLVAVGLIAYFTIYQTRIRRLREWKLLERERLLDKKVRESLMELSRQHAALKEIGEIQSHQVRAPIATILGLVNLFNFKEPADPNNKDILLKLKTATEDFDKVIEQIVKLTNEIEGQSDPQDITNHLEQPE